MVDQRKPFDAANPFEVAADKFRTELCGVASRAFNDPAFKCLDSAAQLEAWLYGALTGYVGICFAHITPDGRDAIMEEIVRYLPAARQQAEAIIASGETLLKTKH